MKKKAKKEILDLMEWHKSKKQVINSRWPECPICKNGSFFYFWGGKFNHMSGFCSNRDCFNFEEQIKINSNKKKDIETIESDYYEKLINERDWINSENIKKAKLILKENETKRNNSQ